MPYLNIETNHPVDEVVRNSVLPKLSALIAAQLGKSETYVMVSFAPPHPMLFAATNDPCAYLSLKSIGLPSAKTPALSAALCQLVEEELGIS
ncbi:MAG: phenylpyruvate tautomerase MIF-related protein [Acidiferrobacterales bacterium]